MSASFHIVGRVLCAGPAAGRIDELLAQVRRERAVVVAKDAQGATFIRFNATDLKLVALACAAARESHPAPLRFGFATGSRDDGAAPTEVAPDTTLVGPRALALAADLATGARDGEVLATAPFAVQLVEAGVPLHTRRVVLPDGRQLAACAVDARALDIGSNGAVVAPAEVEVAATPRHADPASVAESFGTLVRTLTDQAEGAARRQDELETRLDAALGTLATLERGRTLASHLAELEAELDAQLLSVDKRVRALAQLEARLEALRAGCGEAEARVDALLSRSAEIDTLAGVCDTLARQTAALRGAFDAAAAQREPLAALPAQAAQLAATLDAVQQAAATVAARQAALERSAQSLDEKLQAMLEREALVEAVRTEVEQIREIGAQGRADLQHLAGQRDTLAALRDDIASMLARAQDTDAALASINAQRQTVEEVQQRVQAIGHLRADIDVNLEMLGEQRAVIDHMGEKLARLDFTVQEAQNTLRALQREREVAERIEHGLKALRQRVPGRPA